MITYTDSHAHLSSPSVYADAEMIMQRAAEAGISKIINICTDPETLQNGLKLAQRYPSIFNAAATTPHDVAKEGDVVFPLISTHARSGSLVAVGETGLDYHYMHSPPDIQKHFLRQYLRLSLECRLPIIIHCRHAFEDFFQILDEEFIVNGTHAPGVLHCFTGTIKEAEQVLERGWYLSLSGIVTFKKSEELRTIARMVPLNQLLIETDTPYLAPQRHRGKLNEPAHLPEIAGTIADVKGITVKEVAEATSRNALTLFSSIDFFRNSL